MKKKATRKHQFVVGSLALTAVLVVVLVVLNAFGSSGLNIVSLSEMETILSDRSGSGTFVYIGRPTCPFCRDFEPILEGVLEELDVQLAYFETDRADQVDRARRLEIFEELGVTGVPVLVYIENGQTVDILTGVQDAATVHQFFARNGGIE